MPISYSYIDSQPIIELLIKVRKIQTAGGTLYLGGFMVAEKEQKRFLVRETD